MKLFTGALATAILAACLATGCTESPYRSTKQEPAIHLTPTHRTLEVGESTRITAETLNLVGARSIRWDVEPHGIASLKQEDPNGTTAIFTANQPSVYVVRATAQTADGRTVTDDVRIDVKERPAAVRHMDSDRPMTNERINEPLPPR